MSHLFNRAFGLGQSTAKTIVIAGGNVAVLDLNKKLGQGVVKSLGPSTKFFSVDVLASNSVTTAVKSSLAWITETKKELGSIIAAAGVSNPVKIIDKHREPLIMDGFNFVMNSNVRGSTDLVRQYLPRSTSVHPEGPDGERGIIVLVSPSAAFNEQPVKRHTRRPKVY